MKRFSEAEEVVVNLKLKHLKDKLNTRLYFCSEIPTNLMRFFLLGTSARIPGMNSVWSSVVRTTTRAPTNKLSSFGRVVRAMWWLDTRHFPCSSKITLYFTFPSPETRNTADVFVYMQCTKNTKINCAKAESIFYVLERTVAMFLPFVTISVIFPGFQLICFFLARTFIFTVMSTCSTFEDVSVVFWD